MSDEPSSLDDLLQSPFDPPRANSSDDQLRDWWPIVAGIAIGALAVLAGYLISSGDNSAAIETSASTTVATTTAAPATTSATGDTPVDFPAGFVEVTDMVGIKPEYMVDAGDQLVIAFTSATRRGFEAVAGFDGGDWVLETSAGEELTASGIVTSIAVPGGFSVQFEKEGTVVPQRIRLINRWEVDNRDGSIEIPFTGTPFEAIDRIVDLGGGMILKLERLALGEFDGEIDWSLDGAGERGGGVNIVVTVGNETSASAVYFERDGGFNPFGGQTLSDVATEGTIALTVQDQPGAADESLLVDVAVTVVGTLAADAVFELADVPGLDL